MKAYNSAEEWNKDHPENPMTQTTDPKTGATTTSYADGRSTTVYARALDKDAEDYKDKKSAKGELAWFEQTHADEIASGKWNNESSEVVYRHLKKKAAKEAENENA